MKLALLAAAWLAGVLLGLWVNPSILPIVLLLLSVSTTGVLLRAGHRSVWPAVLAGVFLLGLLRVEAAESPPHPLALREKESVILLGRISSDPEPTSRRIKFVFEVDTVDRGSGVESVGAKALVYVNPSASSVPRRDSKPFQYGDVLRLEGELRQPRPFEDFDYPTYLSNQGVTGIMWPRSVQALPRQSGSPQSVLLSKVYGLRQVLSDRIERAIPGPQAAIAQALLLGIRGQISPDVTDDFRATGTSHLLAISGLHVGVLLMLTMGATSRLLGRRWHVYLLLPLAAIWTYALVSGLPISVVRASIMGTVFLAAWALGRPRSALPALALTAAVMVGVEPKVLGQVSFQLSFAALAGIILALPYQAKIAEAITRRVSLAGTWWQVWCWQGVKLISTALVISTAATLATWPLIAFNFDRVPLFGVFSTLLALPALPVILVGSMLTASAGLAHPVIGQFFGWLTWLPLSYLLTLVSQFPAWTVPGAWAGAPLLWAWYSVLGGLLLLPGGLARVKAFSSRVDSLLRRVVAAPSTEGTISNLSPTVSPTLSLGTAVLALALLAGGVILWLQVLNGPDGKLHVYFFNVGQGDSILITTPEGKQVLVDGGPDLEGATRALAGPLSAGDRSLDLVVMTHLDEDHSRGLLEVMDRYQVAAVLVGSGPMEGAMRPEWEAMLNSRHIEAVRVAAGYQVKLEPGVTLEVLNPPPVPFAGSPSDRNNNAVVLRLVYGQISYLLTSDIESFTEHYLVRHSPKLESTVLKVGHHGSLTSTTAPFLERVSPELAVISVGDGNHFGHPHPEVMDRLKQTLDPGRLFRTDRDGRVEFISDGVSLWVNTEEEQP